MDLDVYAFADVAPGSGGVGLAQRLREVVEEAPSPTRWALGLRRGRAPPGRLAASSPAAVLAAVAERTTDIRLTSAVSVLSSDDPVRVFQQFATLDLLSGGRAEITGSWPTRASALPTSATRRTPA